MDLLDLVGVGFILLFLLDWSSFFVLRRACREAKETYGRTPNTLNERKQAAFFIGIGSGLFAGLAMDRIVTHDGVPQPFGLVILLVGLAFASISSVNWLYQALTGRFRLEGS